MNKPSLIFLKRSRNEDYYFEMSNKVKEGESPMFYIRNKMQFHALRVVYYVFGEGETPLKSESINMAPQSSLDHSVDVVSCFEMFIV